jgi:hypothetical protein
MDRHRTTDRAVASVELQGVPGRKVEARPVEKLRRRRAFFQGGGCAGVELGDMGQEFILRPPAQRPAQPLG